MNHGVCDAIWSWKAHMNIMEREENEREARGKKRKGIEAQRMKQPTPS